MICLEESFDLGLPPANKSGLNTNHKGKDGNWYIVVWNNPEKKMCWTLKPNKQPVLRFHNSDIKKKY